jgi:hypothetical protein
MATARPTKRRPGRPAAGIEPGEKASEYRRLMLRLPEETFAELSAAARTIGQPQWRVIMHAVKAYIGAGPVLDANDRDIVRRMLRREAN